MVVCSNNGSRVSMYPRPIPRLELVVQWLCNSSRLDSTTDWHIQSGALLVLSPCSKTALSVYALASVRVMNGNELSTRRTIGTSTNAFFNFCSSLHFQFRSSFVGLLNGCAIVMKFGTTQWYQEQSRIKPLSCFRVFGGVICSMAATSSFSAWIPRCVIKWPRYFSLLLKNWHFVLFIRNWKCADQVNKTCRSSGWLSLVNDYIV